LKQAFELEPREFPFGRRYADMLIMNFLVNYSSTKKTSSINARPSSARDEVQARARQPRGGRSPLEGGAKGAGKAVGAEICFGRCPFVWRAAGALRGLARCRASLGRQLRHMTQLKAASGRAGRNSALRARRLPRHLAGMTTKHKLENVTVRLEAETREALEAMGARGRSAACVFDPAHAERGGAAFWPTAGGSMTNTDVDTHGTINNAFVPPFDAFAAVMALVQLASDPKAVETRLAQLRAAQAAAEKAQRELSRREIFFANETRKAKQDLEAAEKAATARQAKAFEAERALEADKQRIEDFRRREELWTTERLPGGGSRERDWSPLRPDPHYAAPPREPEPELVTEPAPNRPAGSMLTRSVPKKSMRRIADHA
jgi:hypothetical protein